MADILTLEEARTFYGLDVDDTSKDDKITTFLPAVSATIRNFTERDFGSALVTEQREFDYDGSGYIDIDDADTVTAVAWKIPNSDPLVLTDTDWRAGPSRRDDAPVYYFIQVPCFVGVAGSSEMGFTRNLDMYRSDHGTQSVPSIALVTAEFGWPVVPDDVKVAAFWTLEDWIAKPAADQITAESIASYSRSWGSRMSAGPAWAVPSKAQDLLAQYTKHQV